MKPWAGWLVAVVLAGLWMFTHLQGVQARAHLTARADSLTRAVVQHEARGRARAVTDSVQKAEIAKLDAQLASSRRALQIAQALTARRTAELDSMLSGDTALTDRQRETIWGATRALQVEVATCMEGLTACEAARALDSARLARRDSIITERGDLLHAAQAQLATAIRASRPSAVTWATRALAVYGVVRLLIDLTPR